EWWPGERDHPLRRRSHHEDRVAERIDHVESPRTPVLVLWGAPDLDPSVPFIVVRVGIIDSEADTGLAAVPSHGAVERELDRGTISSVVASRAGSAKPRTHPSDPLV